MYRMSKVKKSKKTCTVIIKRGKNAGKKCDKPCRNDNRCKEHNTNRLKYKNTYNNKQNEKTKQLNLIKKIDKIKTGKSKMPNIRRLRSEYENLNRELIMLVQKIYGYKKRIDPTINPFYKGEYKGKNVKKIMELINDEICEEQECPILEIESETYQQLVREKLAIYFGEITYISDITYPYTLFEGTIAEAKKRLKSEEKKKDELRKKCTSKLKLIKEYENLMNKKNKIINDKVQSESSEGDGRVSFSSESNSIVEDSMDDITLPEDDIFPKRYIKRDPDIYIVSGEDAEDYDLTISSD